MAARKAARARRGKAAAPAAGPSFRVAVDEEQRRRLIECCAFFRAVLFREVAPGCFRKQDLQQAEADIDAIIKSPRKSRKRSRLTFTTRRA
jgi:hypothetical protein